MEVKTKNMIPHFQLPRLWEEGQVDPFFEGRDVDEPREKKMHHVSENKMDVTSQRETQVKIAQNNQLFLQTNHIHPNSPNSLTGSFNSLPLNSSVTESPTTKRKPKNGSSTANHHGEIWCLE